jgi:iron(III) transport system substrate-binding protein
MRVVSENRVGRPIGKHLSLGAVVCLAVALAVVAAVCSAPASAASPLLTYKGKDRQAKLLACAKQEGSLTIYTSTTAMNAFYVPAFKKAYPDIGVNVLLDATTLASRVRTEEDGGQHAVDAYIDALGAMDRDPKYFQKVWSPQIGKLRAHLSNDYFVATNGFVEGMAFNTKVTDPKDLPKTWQELTDPKWSGKVYLAADPGSIAYMGVLRRTYGQNFINKLAKVVRTQNASGRATADQVEAGILPIGLSVSASYYQSDAVGKGLPFGWRPLQPVFVGWSGLSVSKAAPHPCAAGLFMDWFLSPTGGLEVGKGLGIPSPIKTDPLLPFNVPGTTPMSTWKLVFLTDPNTYKGFKGGLSEALRFWADMYHRRFSG